MNFRRHRKENLEIGLTPMIDVVFLLLIFFMVTTTFNRENELKIELPEAAGEQKKEQLVVEVTIDAEGVYYVNQKQLINRRISTLKKAILSAAGPGKKPPLLISADAKAQHQYVITALDVARRLGFVHLTFATKNTMQ